MKAVIHWVKYHRRITSAPSVKGMSGDISTVRLETARRYTYIRNQLQGKSDTNTNDPSPDPLKSEAKWLEQETKYINYISTIPIVSGIPLLYVIREEEAVPGQATIFTGILED